MIFVRRTSLVHGMNADSASMAASHWTSVTTMCVLMYWHFSLGIVL